MINPTEEQRKALDNEIKEFFAKTEEQKKQIQEDLKTIKWFSSDGRICDFGCGYGYTTYCLTSILNPSEAIGIDFNSDAINQANLWFEVVKLHKQFSAKEEIPDDVLTKETNQALGIVRQPKFLVRDVVSGENLPSVISLAYCRKLLVNIVVGNYGNNLSGIDGCKLAIQSMVKTIIPGGWFVVVEESSGGDFSQLLEEEGLKQINIVPFHLNGIVPYIRYVYRKLD